MNTDTKLHLIEILIVGAPMWYGVIRLLSLMKDFPPHRHVPPDKIIYPRGMNPDDK